MSIKFRRLSKAAHGAPKRPKRSQRTANASIRAFQREPKGPQVASKEAKGTNLSSVKQIFNENYTMVIQPKGNIHHLYIHLKS